MTMPFRGYVYIAILCLVHVVATLVSDYRYPGGSNMDGSRSTLQVGDAIPFAANGAAL